MTPSSPEVVGPTPELALVGDPALHWEISQFLYREASLLDERRWDEWLALFAEDVRYWMPSRYNRAGREISDEFAPRSGTAHFDDTYASLRQRVARLNTGLAWAENPPSRTRHVVSNVVVLAANEGVGATEEFEVQSYFLVYRNRSVDEVDLWAGRRIDVLRRGDSKRWKIAQRRIELDQSTILSKNLSVFF